MALKGYFNLQPEVVFPPIQHAQCSCFCRCLLALGGLRLGGRTTTKAQRKLKATQNLSPPLPTFAPHFTSLCTSPALQLRAEMHFLPAQQQLGERSQSALRRAQLPPGAAAAPRPPLAPNPALAALPPAPREKTDGSKRYGLSLWPANSRG